MKEKTLLIVDDEYWILYNLVNQYDWNQFNISTVLQACNGEEALALLCTKPIDFLITDMDMPFMDGASLIAHVQENYPSISVIVLSGYSDFPMVHSAMVGGVIDYLLKPVSKNNLYVAMEKLLLATEKKLHRQREAEMAREHYRSVQLSKLLGAKATNQESSNIFAFDFWKPYRVLVVRCKYLSLLGQEDSIPQEECLLALKAMMISTLGDCVIVQNEWIRYELVVFLHDDDTIRDRFLHLKQQLSQQHHIIKSLLWLSKAVVGENQLAPIYRGLNQAYNARHVTFDPHQSMIAEDAMLKQSPVNRLSENAEGQLSRAIATGNSELAGNLIDDFFSPQRILNEQWLYHEFASAAKACSRHIIRIVQKGHADMEVLQGLETLQDELYKEIHQYSIQESISLIHQMLDMTDTGLSQELSPGRLDEVKAYIDANYAEELSLVSLANRFYISPAHLSRSFKKKTSQNLIAYVTEKRITEAKRLLCIRRHAVTEVAFLVGFDDYSYFSQVFKRYAGVSPTEYKKTHETYADA